MQVSREYVDMPRVCVDMHELTQILVNIILNAIQACAASEHAEHHLKLGLRSEGDFALISITDNGIGIKAEELPRVFSYGYTTREEGHGYGLYSASIDAKEMGGTLSVTSPGPGKGATFTLAIPLQPKAADVATTQAMQPDS